MGIQIIDDLSVIWAGDKKNNYKCLEKLSHSYGVYIFRERDSGNILYVGEARAQTAKKRITQYFIETDSGGTFRKNFMEDERCSFNDFKTALNKCQLIVFECPQNLIIRALESLLISLLKPKYNRDRDNH